jgi:gamma-glutamyltranspeptidase
MHNLKIACSTGGMVTSPHALASEAGLDVLRAGGNAIEAAIAIGAALTVTYPHFTGLGGDAFWVIGDRDGLLRTVSGIGQAAANPPAFDTVIPLRGAAATLTTAATVDTFAALLAKPARRRIERPAGLREDLCAGRPDSRRRGTLCPTRTRTQPRTHRPLWRSRVL